LRLIRTGGILLQGALVLPVVPPEEGTAIWRAPVRGDPISRPAPALHLRHSQDWYSNKMRGQRDKRTAAEAAAAGKAVAIIDVSEHRPRRIPSASRAEGETGCPRGSNGAKRSGNWRELIKKVREADPLLCPKCSREMRIVSLIDERAVIERILRHLGMWQQGVRVCPATGPPVAGHGERVIEPCQEDPFPDYDTEPIMAYADG